MVCIDNKRLPCAAQNQGLGFVLAGIVIDRRYFASLMVKLGALASTILTTLLAFRHNAIQGDNADGGCGLTLKQRVAFQSIAGLINASCTWNLTVSAGDVIIIH
jgi:hypothetical protein